MPVRTSARQAAAKATEALHESALAGTRKASGSKRKGSVQGEEEPESKRGKKVVEGETKEEHAPKKIPGKRGRPPKALKAQGKGQGPSEERQQEVNGESKEPSGKEVKPEDKEVKGKVGEEGEKVTEEKDVTGPELKFSEERAEAIPENILEKGIIYFFFRSRVGIEEPGGVEDVARTFIVLRPLPKEAGLGKGPIGDDENCRLLVLPKKKLPTSSRDRYMGFVEKAGVNVKTLRESFKSGEYETKTKGHRAVPSATPLAEGVYAITSTTRTSHLVYIVTIPEDISEVQSELGLSNKGSFIISVKSPKFPGPPSARLPKGPEYPQEVLGDFRDLRWVPLQPKFIEYPGAQFLLVGEAQEELGKGGMTENKPAEKEEAGEELEYLEHENEARVEPLHGKDAVFDDLGLSTKDFPKVPTTWA